MHTQEEVGVVVGIYTQRTKRRKMMKKSWLQATLEEPLKRAASATLFPIISESFENLHLKSLVIFIKNHLGVLFVDNFFVFLFYRISFPRDRSSPIR